MRGIWAVARYTLAQCLRTKLAAAFIAVLAVTLVALALTVTGDGTLGGRIRTFLAYSTAAVSILLSFVTILLGVGVVAGDVRARHVFLLVVKPLPRWQYIVGRWGGIVLLDAALLAVACGSIYAVAQHLRTREALNHNDRVAVETEVFAARAEVRPEPVIDELVARARQRDGGEGFEQSWREYQRSEGLSEPEAKRRAEKDLREAIADQLRSIGPGQSRRWRLAGIEPGAAPVTGRARLRSRAVEYHAEVRPTTPELRPLLEEPRRRRFIAAARVAGVPARITGERLGVVFPAAREQWVESIRPGRSVDVVLRYERKGETTTLRGRGDVVQREAHLLTSFEALGDVTNRMAVGAYVSVRGVDGRVEHVGDERFTVRFFPADARRPQVEDLSDGEEVPVAVRPSVRLRFELSGQGTGTQIPGVWTAGSAASPYPPHVEQRRFPAGVGDTVAIPDRLVGADGELYVGFTNLSSDVVAIEREDLSLLYRVGGFTGNFLRGAALMLMQLMFLAAVGVFAGSFLSFPIGCLVCAAMLPFAMMRGFLADAVKLPRYGDAGPLVWFGHAIFRLMQFLVPDFARTSPGDALAAGRVIPWAQVGEMVALTGGLQCALAVGLGCLIFHKRELARVQV